MPVDLALARRIGDAYINNGPEEERAERERAYNVFYREALGHGWSEGYATGVTDTNRDREYETRNPYWRAA